MISISSYSPTYLTPKWNLKVLNLKKISIYLDKTFKFKLDLR